MVKKKDLKVEKEALICADQKQRTNYIMQRRQIERFSNVQITRQNNGDCKLYFEWVHNAGTEKNTNERMITWPNWFTGNFVESTT